MIFRSFNDWIGSGIVGQCVIDDSRVAAHFTWIWCVTKIKEQHNGEVRVAKFFDRIYFFGLFIWCYTLQFPTWNLLFRWQVKLIVRGKQKSTSNKFDQKQFCDGQNFQPIPKYAIFGGWRQGVSGRLAVRLSHQTPDVPPELSDDLALVTLNGFWEPQNCVKPFLSH